MYWDVTSVAPLPDYRIKVKIGYTGLPATIRLF
jgi:hypothetical protein